MTPLSAASENKQDEAISVEFTLDENDILALQNHYLRSSPDRRRFNRFFAAMLLITVSIAAADLVLVLTGDRLAIDYGTWVVIFFGTWTYLLFRARAASTQSVQRALKEGKNRLLFSRQRLTINSAGIQTTSSYGNLECKWGAIEKVLRVDEYIFFFLSVMSALIVPRRAFRSGSDFEQFFSTAERHHRAASPGKCRKCGYDLHGNQSGTCPECGTAIKGSA